MKYWLSSDRGEIYETDDSGKFIKCLYCPKWVFDENNEPTGTHFNDIETLDECRPTDDHGECFKHDKTYDMLEEITEEEVFLKLL